MKVDVFYKVNNLVSVRLFFYFASQPFPVYKQAITLSCKPDHTEIWIVGTGKMV